MPAPNWLKLQTGSLFLALFLGCGGGGNRQPDPPSNLAYSTNPAVYTKGRAIAPNVPSHLGGTIITYGVTPALPAVLSLDPATGIITGTPVALAQTATFTVTGTNGYGSTSTTLAITVNDEPPIVHYPNTDYTLVRGVDTTLIPSMEGGAVLSWSVEPPLPAGLVLSDGSILGRPTSLSETSDYTVTASNSGGNCVRVLKLKVVPQPPVIQVEPVNQIASIGQTATFSAKATGEPPLGYQWYRDGNVVVGATADSYTTPPLTMADHGARFRVVVSDSYGSRAYSVEALLTVAQGRFTPSGPLLLARANPCAVLLLDGRVLVAGGLGADGKPLASAELFDPTNGSSVFTSMMASPRAGHTATLLKDGRVLLVGGWVTGYGITSAECFDPATGLFSPTGSMAKGRRDHAAVRLSTGEVLIAGGVDGSQQPYHDPVFTAELYDPANGSFSKTGVLNTDRQEPYALRLPDGTVLLSGGYSYHYRPVFPADRFNPATSKWTATSSMGVECSTGPLSLLTNGQVLLAGTLWGNYPNAQCFDQVTGLFTPIGPLLVARDKPTLTSLPDGRVLVAGGYAYRSYYPPVGQAEIFDPIQNRFTLSGVMVVPRKQHVAIPLPDGTVLMVGGMDAQGSPIALVERFSPGM